MADLPRVQEELETTFEASAPLDTSTPTKSEAPRTPCSSQSPGSTAQRKKRLDQVLRDLSSRTLSSGP